VTPNGLRGHNCLMWDGQHDHLNQWPFLVNGKVEKLPMQGKFRSSDGSTLFELCVAGTGIMRLAEHLAVPAIRTGKLVPLLSDYQAKDETAIYAVYLAERQLVPRVRAFVDHLAEVFHNPPWQSVSGR
jgi:DNA-binding transcriptional LysR family regulator